MKIPVLLEAPSGRPARALGGGPHLKAAVQGLVRASWPVVVHEPAGQPQLTGLPGAQVVNYPPAGPGLRQSSLVLLGVTCPPDWREQALSDLKGTGIPFWDEADPKGSTLALPMWVPGEILSFAAWSSGGLKGWEKELAEDFLRAHEGFAGAFLRLSGEIRDLVLPGSGEEGFRQKVASQLANPELMSLLLRGEYDRARSMALKIVGSTTRSLD
jgi:hypothetical protein